MNKNTLSVAIVGHANAGKTSLIRTLLRDSEFGEVADQAGTTRHVEGSAIEIDKKSNIALFDTPGLEDSMHLFYILSRYFSGRNVDGIQRLNYFLEHIDEYPELDQEAKVLRSLLSNDLIFYVIDLREPILGKYRDELQILSYAAKPIIPVLNFTEQGNVNLGEWKRQLARLNFHAYVAFDNVNFVFSDELKIYKKMQSLLVDKEELLQHFIEQRQQQWDERLSAARMLVANLFVDCACLRYQAKNDDQDIKKVTLQLQHVVREAEKRAMQQLLTLYQFRLNDLDNSDLAIEQGGWHLDLFSSDNLQEFGITLTSNIAKGAGLGVAIDLATAGLTLGAAALTGGVAGALWGVKKRYYDEIQAKLKGARYICLNDITLQVLWLRQIKLLELLQKRGHASLDKIDYHIAKPTNEMPKMWNKWLRQLHNHPNWSLLSANSGELEDNKRGLFSAQLASQMESNSL